MSAAPPSRVRSRPAVTGAVRPLGVTWETVAASNVAVLLVGRCRLLTTAAVAGRVSRRRLVFAVACSGREYNTPLPYSKQKRADRLGTSLLDGDGWRLQW